MSGTHLNTAQQMSTSVYNAIIVTSFNIHNVIGGSNNLGLVLCVIPPEEWVHEVVAQDKVMQWDRECSCRQARQPVALYVQLAKIPAFISLQQELTGHIAIILHGLATGEGRDSETESDIATRALYPYFSLENSLGMEQKLLYETSRFTRFESSNMLYITVCTIMSRDETTILTREGVWRGYRKTNTEIANFRGIQSLHNNTLAKSNL